jgi:glutaryl-CoA dehydrogenase
VIDSHDPLALEPLLSDAERAVRDRVRAWVAERWTPGVAGWFEEARWPVELVPELGELGVLGMHLEGHGCPGGSAVEYGLASLELEAGDTALRTFCSVQGSLAMGTIHAHGSEEQKAEWLPRMARGEAIGCFGLTEPRAGSDPSAMETRARRDGGDWILDGRKRWIGMGSIADVAVVWAKADDDEVRGFLVPTDARGFSARDITGKLALRASVQCELDLDGVRLPASAALPGAGGLASVLECLNGARYGIAWGAMGAARTCYEAALARAQAREQFGKPIAAYQLTQRKLVDMAIAVGRGTLLALHLGRTWDAGRLEPEHLSLAKLDNTRVALGVAREARTIFGGDGITLAEPVMRHMLNLEAPYTYEGTAEVHTLIAGEALTGHRAFA